MSPVFTNTGACHETTHMRAFFRQKSLRELDFFKKICYNFKKNNFFRVVKKFLKKIRVFDKNKKICYNLKKNSFFRAGSFFTNLIFKKKYDKIIIENKERKFVLMNYDFNSIESLLRSGVSADEIAQAFTKNLNDAIDITKRDNKRAELFENLANSWNEVLDDWLRDHTLPDGISKEDVMMEARHAEELFGQVMDLMMKVAPLFKVFSDEVDYLLANKEPTPAPVKKNTVVKPKDEDLDTEDFDALMRAFLDSIK